MLDPDSGWSSPPHPDLWLPLLWFCQQDPEKKRRQELYFQGQAEQKKSKEKAAEILALLAKPSGMTGDGKPHTTFTDHT